MTRSFFRLFCRSVPIGTPASTPIVEKLEERQFLSTTTIVSDDFSGSAVNSKSWYIPTWLYDGDGTWINRTQLICSQNAKLPKQSNGSVHLTLDSYNPTGFSFYGYELRSKKTITLNGTTGADVTIRAKLNAPIPGGVVGGLFLYGTKTVGGIYPEIDVAELVSNRIGAANTNVFYTDSSSAGTPAFFRIPNGGKNTAFHDYTVKVRPTLVAWYIDGKLVRTERNVVPQGTFQVRLNIWAPGTQWPDAYNAGIQPTSNPKNNRRFSMDVDNVIMKKVDVPIPFTVTGASVNLSSNSAMQYGASISASGTITGTGNGDISYKWVTLDSNNSVLTESDTLTTTMGNGTASVYDYITTDAAGSFKVVLRIESPATIESAPAECTIAEAVPSVTITSVPLMGVSGYAFGRVDGVKLSDYAGIAVYIKVSGGWWTKPTWASPITGINADGTWVCDVDTGGYDENATHIRAYLIPKGFSVPGVGGGAIPASLSGLIYDEVTR